MRLAGSLIALLMGFTGCTETHHVQRALGSPSPLSRQASAYIGVPQDGNYGSTTYQGSGALAAQAIAVAFAPYVTRATVGIKKEDFDSALQTAKTGGHTLLLYPQILHWEDRRTEWSGMPDVVSVKVSVVGTETGKVIDSAVVGGKSSWWTFGGDRPEHLLPKPLSDYAASLFAP